MEREGRMQTIECRFCTGEVQAHAKKCKHCGEWLNQSERPEADTDEREICTSCGKKMMPRIITGPPLVHGQGSWTPVPKKSICPFCGATHKKFPASVGQRIGATLAFLFVIFVFYSVMRR